MCLSFRRNLNTLIINQFIFIQNNKINADFSIMIKNGYLFKIIIFQLTILNYSNLLHKIFPFGNPL